MKKKYYILTVLMVFTQLSAQVKVTQSTSKECSFTWEMDKFDTLSVQHEGKTFTDLSFDGSNIKIGENGDPAIPGYSVFLGVPPKGEISVSFVAERIKTVSLSHQITSIQSSKDEKRQPLITYSSPWISNPVYTQIRDYKAAQFVIRPFLYDKASNTVRVITKGHFTITFPPYPFRLSSPDNQSDYNRMLSKLLCNTDIARGWLRAAGLAKSTAESYPLSNNQKVYQFKVGDGHSGVNEATTNENGIIRIPGSKIVQLFGNVKTSRITLYGSYKGELPDSVPGEGEIPSGIVEIPLMRVDLNKNGTVDADDYFLAYVTGASDFMWNGKFAHKLDRYDDYRNYFLTLGSVNGKSVTLFSNETGVGDTITSFENRIVFKHPSESPGTTEGKPEFIWYKLSSRSPTFQYKPELPGLDISEAGSIKFIMSPNSGGVLNAIFNESICTNCFSNGEYPITKWGDNNLQLGFTSSSTSIESNVELTQFEVVYSRKLEADSLVKMTVFSSSNAGVQHYKLKVLTNELIYIFRIPADQQNISLIDTISKEAGKSYVWSDSGNCGTTYFVCSRNSIGSLPDLQLQQSILNSGNTIRDLRNTSNSTDFLIITHPDFIFQAESLAVHKKKNAGFSTPAVVRIEDIYRLFSGGNIDPSAIRNFITYVRRNWNDNIKPDYVLLVGTGHYDYKNVTTSRPIYIPVYYDNDKLIEDYFVYTEKAINYSVNFPQLAIGRLPCETAAEASTMIKKIIEMEDPAISDYGDWRNRALFVADDDMQGDKVDPIVSMTPHSVSSDRSSDVVETQWPSIDLRKIYLYEYEWNNANEKPEASRAIINEINNGVGYINWFGHGSEEVWADEHVLTPQNVVSLYNQGRYPIISSFSCSVGKFDVPGKNCLSAVLVKADRAGSIISISSTRLAYANANENLAINFYSSLFDTSRTTSAGMAYISAKAAGYSDNHRSYALLGDPSICMVKPIRKVNLVIRDSDKNVLDTIKALQKVTISGSVSTANGEVDQMFGTNSNPAYIQLGLFNAADSAGRKDGGTNDLTIKYLMPGKPVFLGKTQVRMEFSGRLF